jgi:hypothetical protein
VAPARRLQAETMIEICERQLARMTELRGHHGNAPGHLSIRLDHEIDQTRERLEWFRNLQAGLDRGFPQEQCRPAGEDLNSVVTS